MASREFTDAHGRRWNVWEVQPSLAERRRGLADWRLPPRVDRRVPVAGRRRAGKYATGWLVFETPGERRRLVPIPPSWESASDAELDAYCTSATPARAPRRLIE